MVSQVLAESPGFDRVCIQCLNYSGVVKDALALVSIAKRVENAKISISIPPISPSEMQLFVDAKVDNIGIALDACSPDVFDQIKGKGRRSGYSWDGHIASIRAAQEVFGKGRVTTHLVVGLGEEESELAKFLIEMKEMGVRVALFAFTPVKGTQMAQRAQPDIGVYRRVQILRDLLQRNLITREQVVLDERGRITFDLPRDSLKGLLGSGNSFRVTGCPGCNRPYYNEKPSGVMYNYFRPLTEAEVERALAEAEVVI